MDSFISAPKELMVEKKNEVNTICEWLKSEAHLPEIYESQVLLFLHSCSYDLEITKQTIEKYFTFRTNSVLFQNVTQELVRRTLVSCFLGFLPKKTKTNELILLLRFLDPRAELYNCLEQTQTMLAILIFYFHHFGPVTGVTFIIDLKDGGFGHLFRINIRVIKQLIYFLQEAVPTKTRSIHMVNPMAMSHRYFILMKPLMKKELYEMIELHLSLDTLREKISDECLPAEYGGSLPSIFEIHEENTNYIMQNWSFFEWHNNQKVDESKRKRIIQQNRFLRRFWSK